MIHLRTVLTIVAVGSALAGVRGHAQEPAEALPGGRIVKLPGLVADLENRHVDLDLKKRMRAFFGPRCQRASRHGV